MATDIVMHDYDDLAFGQLTHDTQLGKQLVPKGYVNVSAMCKVAGKKISHWMLLEPSKAYLEAFSLDAGNSGIQMLIKIGGKPNGDASLQGTWAHPDVAIEIARWINPRFAVWANRTLRLVIGNQFTPQTADAAIAQSQLKEHYSRTLDGPDPWERLFEQKACQQMYALGGPNFFWDFCYHWLTPVERCEIELKNPVVNGRRHDRIHQFFSQETKKRLQPYLAQLLAIVFTAKGDREVFLAGYRNYFMGIDEPDLF